MASHGRSRHLKRLASPVAWGTGRKKIVWAKKGSAGAHPLKESIPLTILLRDVLVGVADTASQARHLVSAGGVLVDGRRVSSDAFTVGLMDVVSLQQGKAYRIVPSGRKMVAVGISEASAKKKYCRVINKVRVNKSKVQLNLHDGRNLLIEREEDTFKTGDTLVLSIPGQELKNVLKFLKGARCLVYKGKHAGEIGELVDVMPLKGNKPANAKLVSEGHELVTLKKYLFVVDKEFGAGGK